MHGLTSYVSVWTGTRDIGSTTLSLAKWRMTVDLYHSGIWDKERALKEIRVYPGYDQIAFITQKAIDQTLVFSKASEVEL